MTSSKDRVSQLIKDKARALGFKACGIAGAVPLDQESGILRQWLKDGHHGTMAYMNRNVDKRLNPLLLNDWARSVIMVLYNYYPDDPSLSENNYKISKYAYGKDYHDVIKNKLQQIVDAIEDEMGEITARVFVDSAPVMEKVWAVKCGLGWTGKNSCLINKSSGSFFFLGTIITNIELSYNEEKSPDHCGQCTKCMDACPNAAIISPGIIDARKCISYLSIEHQGAFSSEDEGKLHGWIFGCDICQDVCPWNRFSSPHREAEFLPSPALKRMTDQDWKDLDEKTFHELFDGTALERTGFAALRRNIGTRNSE